MAAPGCVSILQPIWGKKAYEEKKERNRQARMEQKRAFIRTQGRIAAGMVKAKEGRIAKKKATKASREVGLGIIFLSEPATSTVITSEEEKEACRRILNIIRYGCIFGPEL